MEQNRISPKIDKKIFKKSLLKPNTKKTFENNPRSRIRSKFFQIHRLLRRRRSLALPARESQGDQDALIFMREIKSVSRGVPTWWKRKQRNRVT